MEELGVTHDPRLTAIDANISALRVTLSTLGSEMHAQKTWDRPMTKVEAASYLGINPDTLCKWARAGKIAYCRLGEGQRAPMRFTKKDLDHYLSRVRIPTVEEIVQRRA